MSDVIIPEARTLLGEFRPLTEDEQRALLFVMLDCIDWYTSEIEIEQARKKPRQTVLTRLIRERNAYLMLSDPFIKPKEWMAESGLDSGKHLLQQGERMMREYESKKGQA